MAFSIVESRKSPTLEYGRDGTFIQIWIVRGLASDMADDVGTAVSWALTPGPPPAGGGIPSFLELPANDYIATLADLKAHQPDQAPYTWELETLYTVHVNTPIFTFNTAGGTQHILAALQHVQTYNWDPNTSTQTTNPTPQDGLLNVTDQGVEGLDIDIGGFEFQITIYLTLVTYTYLELLQSLTDTVNANVFSASVDGVPFTWQIGECRFKGATGSFRAFGDYEITLNFNGNRNQNTANGNAITIGPVTGIQKNGQDYLWVDFQPTADNTNYQLARVVRNVYIDQVYAYENWSGILPGIF